MTIHLPLFYTKYVQFLCQTSQVATPYPLRLPGTAWSLHPAGGREGRGNQGPVFSRTQRSSVHQRLESYICGIREPAPGILVTGHRSVKPAD